MKRNIPHVKAVYRHGAVVYVIEAADKAHYGRFSCTGRTHKRYGLSCPYAEIKITQHRFILYIAECDMREFHIAVYFRQSHCSVFIGNIGRIVHGLKYSFKVRH